MIILSNIKKLYDGSAADAGAVHRGVDLHLENGRVHELRPHQQELSVGPEHTLIDASSFTVTPGLIDCHGHVTILGISAAEIDRMNSAAGLLAVEKILFATLVDGGVTTMRDIGGATHLMKRLVDAGSLIGPRLKIAICMLSTTGGHADFRSPDRCHAELSRLFQEAPGRPSSIVDGPLEARKRVREIAACGADLIKLCTSPGVASPGDKLEHREFTAEEIQVICDEAEARGLRVAAHAHSRSGIEMAIKNGVHDIQHISFMDEQLAEMASDRGCTVTPTSWIVRDLVKMEGLDPAVLEKAKVVCDVHTQAVQHAARGGLKILAGTDPVLPGMHGKNFTELGCLVDDGLSPLAAWYAGTGLAADEIGQTDAGTIAPGQRADLLLCSDDVIDDPRLFEQGALVEVMKDGVAYRGGIAALPQRTFADLARKEVQ